MDVTLDKRYDLSVGVDQAWTVLSDIRATAGCMPGAAITEQIDESNYKGTVTSKIGPATMTFGGDIEVQSVDPVARQLKMIGKGVDRSGSSASMELTASIEPGDSAQTSVLAGHAVIIVNGKLAQLGGRLLMPVSDMMLGQFADNFRIAAAAVTVPSASGDVHGAAPELPVTPAATAGQASAPAKELNALALIWALIKRWFAGLSGKRH